ncbi:MAG: peptidylprolyl isomerase [Vicinamibacterales bacterium]
MKSGEISGPREDAVRVPTSSRSWTASPKWCGRWLVREEIVDQLRWQKAQQQAEALAKDIASNAKTPADLERIAGERKIAFTESGLFLQDEPIDSLGGPQPELASAVFALPEGQVSAPQRIARGWVIATVSGKQDSYLPELTEVRDRVREDVVNDKAAALAKERATAIATELKTAKDFAATAKNAASR